MRAPEFKTREDFGFTYEKGWTEQGWEDWLAHRQEWCDFWAWLSKRRFHALPEEKGIPVPGTGAKRYHSKKSSGKTGVSGSSRILPHRYMDEGDNGKGHRREVRRKERPLWISEVQEELNGDQEAYTVRAWFYDDADGFWNYPEEW